MNSAIKRLTAAVALGLFLTAGFFSCKNPLISVIEDDVTIAITPPEVLTTYPEHLEQDIPITLNTIIVTFSKNIDSGSVNAETFIVSDSTGTAVNGSRKVENDTVTFTPNSGLAVGTVYTVSVDGIKDIDGNLISDTYSWSFTTGIEGDSVRPTISSVLLNDGAVWTNTRSVEINIEAFDNFGITQMNVSTSGSFSDAGWIPWQESFTIELPAGDGQKSVYILIKDGSGNVSSSSISDSINMDTSVPEVSDFLLNSGKSASRESTVSVAINGEDSEDSSGVTEYQIRTAGEEWPSSWSPLVDGIAFIESYDLNVAMGESQTLEARVRDVAGNISEVLVSSIIYEQTPPSVDQVAPYENQTNVPYNTSVVEVLFNEEMDPSSFTTENFYIETGGSPLSGDFNFSNNGTTPYGRAEITGLVIYPNTDYLVYIKPDIRDAAGNEYGKTKTWYFRTGTAVDTTAPEGGLSITGFQTAPGGNDYFFELPNGDWATNRGDLDLLVAADDDYNSVYAMKFWGEGDLSAFEEGASWELYNSSRFWTLGATEKTYFLLYRFQDSAGNISLQPSQFKLTYDSSAPTITSLNVSTASVGSFGYLHTNNADGIVEVVVSAHDIGGDGNEGSGLYQIRLSNDGTFPGIIGDEEGEAGWDPDDPDNWKDWSPIISGWTLGDTSEDLHTIYVDIRDYLGNYLTTPAQIDTILDKTPPVVGFSAGDYKEVNAAEVQTGSFSDNVLSILSGLGESVSASDLIFSWRQADQNEGLISFDNASAMAPSVSANADGTYSLEVTVSDYAGNSTIGAVPFIWDQTTPADITDITSYDSEGNPVSSSSDTGDVEYTNYAEPTIEWPSPEGADFYRIIFGSPSDTVPPGWEWEDWNWETTFPPNYQESNVPYLAAEAPSYAGANDGAYRFYVTAWDNAGNRSNYGSEIFIDLGIDTLNPVITNGGQLISANEAKTLNYSISTEPSGSENAIYDQLNPSDASPGSGIASIDWTVVSGIGVVSINESDPRNPVLSAVTEGLYEISVTVTDNAANQVTESMYFEWDVTAPGAPSVSGVNHTSDQTPTWSWSSGGGGNGTYEFQLEYQSGGVVPGYDWTIIEDTSMTPATALDDNTTYVLKVKEYDNAGNVSATGEKSIWVDTSFTAEPPPITLTGGDYTRIISESTAVTWTWSSGLSSGGGTYRYKLDNSYLGDITTTTDTTTSFSHTFATNGTDDGYHYLYVEEYDSVNLEWVDLVNSSYVRIDMTRPNVPNLNVPASPTTDTTPTWSWSSGGGGMGYYRYSTNGGSSWSYTYSNNVTISLADNTYNFWLQERDSAGNWSYSATDSITIDTTPPSINSFSITSGTLTDEGNRYTASTGVTLSISASTSDGQAMQMRFYNSAYTNWEAYSTSKTLTLPAGEGQKDIYVQFMDYLGNVSGWTSDTIILDQSAPDVGTVSINGGAAFTPSLNAYLTVSSSDNKALIDELEVQYYYSGNYSLWRSLSLGTTFSTYNTDNGAVEDIEFTPVAGSKLVYVRFRDPAGNYSSWSSTDTITLQIPEPTHATKGTYIYNGNGKAIVYYNTVTEDSGPNTTYYYTYWTDDPAADPNNGDPVTLLDGTTAASNYVYNFGEGQLRYFFIRAYNADTGGYGPYSTTSVLGFSSNVTVIYDDDVGGDAVRAQELKTLLEDGDGRIANQISNGFVSGTMPSYTVTLLPEDLISGTYDGTTQRIDGDPIIITPQASFELYYYSPDNKVRNVVSNYNGIIAMGYYSGSFLSRVNSNFSAWGLTGTAPSGIIGSMTLSALTTTKTRPYVAPIDKEEVLYTPLVESYFATNGTSALVTSIFVEATGRRGVNLVGGLAPSDGAIYAGDPNSTAHFPVVRQGRFLNFAYYEVPDTYSTTFKLTTIHRTGKVFFINLVARMDDY